MAFSIFSRHHRDKRPDTRNLQNPQPVKTIEVKLEFELIKMNSPDCRKCKGFLGLG